MAGSQKSITNNGAVAAPWNAIAQALGANSALAGANALQTTLFVPDQYQNTVMVIGSLNQVVTLGAGWNSHLTPPTQGTPVAGVQIGTGRTDFGIAVLTAAPVFTTITTVAGSTSATVASASGLSNAMLIGAAEVNGVSAIVPGSTFTISGTTVTLSNAAAESGTSLYCVACSVWTNLVTHQPANVT